MATGNLDSAVKEEDYLSLKVEDDDDATFDDDYSTDSLAGLPTISNRIGLVRDEVYQRCGEPRKRHGSQCSKPCSHRRGVRTLRLDLFAPGGLAGKHFASMMAACIAAIAEFLTRSQALTQSHKLVPERSNVLTCVFYRKMFIGGLNWETTDGEPFRNVVVTNVC